MKRSLILCILLALIGWSCKKDYTKKNHCNKRYYYYFSNKIQLTEVFDKGSISFYDTLSVDTINEFLKQYSNIHCISEPVKSSWIMVTIDSKKCSETDIFLSAIKKDTRVSNCNKFLITDKGIEIGINDIFICKLKSDSSINHMNGLIAKTNTKLVRLDTLGGYYLIRADKNSKGDALDMADEFFDSVYFEYTEPDFIGGIQRF